MVEFTNTQKFFLEEHKDLIDNKQYNSLLNLFYDRWPGDTYKLAKLLVEANINVPDITSWNNSDIISYLKDFTDNSLVDLALDLLSSDYDFQYVYDRSGELYFENNLGDTPVYYDRENFIKFLYDVLIENSAEEWNYLNHFSWEVFFNWGMTGIHDQLMRKVFLITDESESAAIINKLPQYIELDSIDLPEEK